MFMRLFSIILCSLVFSCADVKSAKINILGFGEGYVDFYQKDKGETYIASKQTDTKIERDSALPMQKNNAGQKLPTINKEIDKEWQDITSQLGIWEKEGDSVEEGQGYVSISNLKGKGQTFLRSIPINKAGTYRMIAMVKAINVTRQGNENYARGKFQTVILENGREVDWPDNDFEGSSDWQLKSVQGRVADQSASLYFRIGLQRASGTVLVRDIHIYWKP